MKKLLLFSLLATYGFCDDTIALWLFDEPEGLYPSCLLTDAGPHYYDLALGRGGRIVPGRFGRALEPCPPIPLEIRGESRSVLFGITPPPKAPGRTVEPLHWGNATFCALATVGEKHLRSPNFANPTETRLNLGAFDWTVEFWFLPGEGTGDGVVFEIGEGPRGENERVTRLLLRADRTAFELYNDPARATIVIPSDAKALRSNSWHHLAFVYDAAQSRLRHYVDGVLQRLPGPAPLRALNRGDEAYFSVGRDGRFERPLPGRLDELRFSARQVYRENFQPPASFSQRYREPKPSLSLKAGPPLLFGREAPRVGPVRLGSRKHLFLDDALVEEMQGVRFVPNPPRWAEKVAEDLRGHLSLVEDEQGVLRIYYRGPRDSLAVITSRDGVRWEKPDLGRGEFEGQRNIVLTEPVGLGNVFVDPNAPPDCRWKYFSGIRRRSMYVFCSADGWSFRRHETVALPFAGGSQSIIYYDDQRQLYVGHHRADYGATRAGATERRYGLSETKDLMEPWPYQIATPERTRQEALRQRIKSFVLDPWWLDNGPLSPPGLGIELPTVFGPDDRLDPPGADIYVTKVVKYPWAPDAYLAFPAVYFHYEEDGPVTRQILGRKERQRGSGVVEVQLAVSRDGLDWKRYPRPAYVPIGFDGSNRIHMLFMTHGLVRRGNEIWQYVGGHGGNGIGYHSAWVKGAPSPLWRMLQRLDGFVAAEGDYTGGWLVTRPLIFEGNRLVLNIDTGAVGYAQVGFLDSSGAPIPGYSVDECIYINGDFLATEVEWLKKGVDVSELAGRVVQLVFRLRGARLYAMQFEKR